MLNKNQLFFKFQFIYFLFLNSDNNKIFIICTNKESPFNGLHGFIFDKYTIKIFKRVATN